MYLTVLLLLLLWLCCLFRVQTTEAEAAEAEAAEQRMQEQVEAANAAKAQLAVEQLVRICYTEYILHTHADITDQKGYCCCFAQSFACTHSTLPSCCCVSDFTP